MAVNNAVTIHTLTDLDEQATEQLKQVDAATSDPVVQPVDAACEVRTLVHYQRLLRHQTALLADEETRLPPEDAAKVADYSHKIRQHRGRLQSFLDRLRACLASLTQKTG